MKKRKFKPNLKFENGRWYAYSPNNSKEAMAYLVPAISFVDKQNRLLGVFVPTKNQRKFLSKT